MSGLARVYKPTRVMIQIPGRGAFNGGCDVYRAPDGVGVVVVGQGIGVRQTPHGPVRVTGKVTVEFPSKAAYDAAKKIAYHKNPELYVKTVGVLGIDDDADHAPPLPVGALFGSGSGAGNTMPALAQYATTDAENESIVQVAGLAGVELEEMAAPVKAAAPSGIARFPFPARTLSDLLSPDDDAEKTP